MRSGAFALGLLAILVLSGSSVAAAEPPVLAEAGATVTRVPTQDSGTPTEDSGGTPTPPPASSVPTANATSVPAGATVTPMPSAATPTPAPSAASATATPVPVSGSPTPAAANQMDQSADPFRDREDRMALMVGRARVNAGLLPLARSVQLDRAAIAHGQNMAARGYMDHDGPDGSPASRAAAQGYETPRGSAWLVVETISAISDDPEGALGWWLSDGVHRRVVLRAVWREVGVGYVQGGPYGRFWVALFGCRPNMLPPVLMDGMLDIPTESCGRSADAFGPVQSVRVGETSAAAASQDWTDYAAQQPWPAGRPAVVGLRDASGQQLEVHAADPTGAATQVP